MANESEVILTVTTADGERFELPTEVASQSRLLKQLISCFLLEGPSIGPFSLPSYINGTTFTKIIEWCTRHKGEVYIPNAPFVLKKEDEDWLNVGPQMVNKLRQAADYLDIFGILDLIEMKFDPPFRCEEPFILWKQRSLL